MPSATAATYVRALTATGTCCLRERIRIHLSSY